MRELVALLTEKNLRVATAESCTGGLGAALVTEAPGASVCFDMGVITYSNGAKEKLLGVRAETLRDFGAVSEQTAREMAEGIRTLSGAEIGVSVTGIAGPGGGSVEKPVGLVYIGVSGAYGTFAYRHRFAGDRTAVRSQSAQKAIETAADYVRRFYE